MPQQVLVQQPNAAQPESPESIVIIDGQPYSVHPYGGGLVALTASVAPHVYVAPRAMVKDHAFVDGIARLFDEALIEGDARVTGMCTLRGFSSAGGDAILMDGVSLEAYARVDGSARIEGSIKLQHRAHVSEGHLRGSFTIL